MAIAVTDVNKSTIMKMLQVDVFGFSAEEIEEKAKEVHNLVVNGDDSQISSSKFVGGYGRTSSGCIAIYYNGYFDNKGNKSSKSKRK